MPMSVDQFLFPDDLKVCDEAIENVLVIGTCMADQIISHFRQHFSATKFDYINLSSLPDLSRDEVEKFDLIYVSMPLRNVLGDSVVKFGDFLGFLGENTRHSIAALRFMLEAVLKYNKKYGVLTVISNFVVPQRAPVASLNDIGSSSDVNEIIRELNREIYAVVRQFPNAYVADIDAIAASLGKNAVLDDSVAFLSHGAFSHPDSASLDRSFPRIEPVQDLKDLYKYDYIEYLDAIWRQISQIYRIVNQIDSVKLVIFDLDDTLWRGLAGDHYGDDSPHPPSEGWPMGLWEAIQHLKARGILTAVCSKNEESLVRARWSRMVPEPWISLDDFTFVEIGWKPKAEVVGAIMRKASLTAKSVVFVDDNPVERNSVKAAFPDLRVLGDNPHTLRRALLWSSETQTAHLTAESKARDAMLRKQGERELARTSMSREEFLRSLQCKVDLYAVRDAADERFARSLELINKTNQFNTTGERLTYAEAAAYLSSGGVMYVFDVRDRFTSYGLVGVVRTREAAIDQFAMSCRVLGMDVETTVVIEIVRDLLKRAAGPVRASIVETSANMVCRDIWKKSGFHELSNEGMFEVVHIESIDSAVDVEMHLVSEMTTA